VSAPWLLLSLPLLWHWQARESSNDLDTGRKQMQERRDSLAIEARKWTLERGEMLTIHELLRMADFVMHLYPDPPQGDDVVRKEASK
jgi:ketol-acid reductoisomerase